MDILFQAEDGRRDAQESRGLEDVYKGQPWTEISAIDEFSRRLVVSILKIVRLPSSLTVVGRLVIKMERKLGNEHPKSLGSGNIQTRTFNAFPGVVSLSG